MNKKSFSWDAFYRIPIIGIIRNLTLDDIESILPVYQQSGLTTIEITMNTKEAAEIIGLIRSAYPKLNTGAGTVCIKKDRMLALDGGAVYCNTHY